MQDTLYTRRNHNAKGTDQTGLNATGQAVKKASQAEYLNIDKRIALFQGQLKNEHAYRIPLQHLRGIGKINFPSKIDYSFKLFLETNMNKLFESQNSYNPGVAIPTADA